MKITMNIKITSLGLAGLLLATACSNDETQLIECGNEISFNTHVSRATETTTANLKNFKVWANATGFSSQRFIDGLIASKPDGKNYFTFDNAVFWPQDVAMLDVFAVSPAVLTASVSVNANGPTISNFTPATAAKDQADLVVAYSQAKRADGTNISLKFNHALSQIEVNATGGVNRVSETKHVWIKGAWLMNVCSSGTLAFDKDKATENYMNWSVGSAKTKYGIEFTSVQALDHTNTPLLASRFESSNMLLVPQQLATWNINDEADKTDNASKGAYILVLCRVEATHPGTEHPGADGSVTVKTMCISSSPIPAHSTRSSMAIPACLSTPSGNRARNMSTTCRSAEPQAEPVFILRPQTLPVYPTVGANTSRLYLKIRRSATLCSTIPSLSQLMLQLGKVIRMPTLLRITLVSTKKS